MAASTDRKLQGRGIGGITMARYIDADELEFNVNTYLNLGGGELCYLDDVFTLISRAPTIDVQEVKHGKWIFHERTKLVPTNKLDIKEEYTNGHDCTVVDNTNVNKKIMIMKKHITVRVPVCSICGWHGDDESSVTQYCPNCGARMDGDNNA